ncbi:hypothetical protein KW782_00210 [Candidatus Parcubacteria bacterium]|nr:hypothetical protein [Candidatus Parcubacteria bacterium]
MFVVRRSVHNPILSPVQDHPWEAYAVFNGCPIQIRSTTHLLYRAMSTPERFENSQFSMSQICKATSKDGIHFGNRSAYITPEKEWERYGCEDPRVTYLNGKYYTFYTALSHFPFNAEGIKIGVAVSNDLETITAKHLVTPFNSKAMALFPEKINGKFTMILTANSDLPPSKIAIAQCEREEEMWSAEFWNKWYKNIDSHIVNLKRKDDDQIEVGAVPLKTKYGWLLIYAHIQKYFSPDKVFGIEAVLLDLKDPKKIIGRTSSPMFVPEESYEKYGTVPNTIFPSGAVIEGDTLRIFYGSTDTTVSITEVTLSHLIFSMLGGREKILLRSAKNPILKPTKNSWENRAVFNPAAFELHGQVHLLYRAMSEDNTSTIGYAVSNDGVTISERLKDPIYTPHETFERKGVPNGNSGCEDARAVLVGNRIYMTYTAYNGIEPPAVAMTSITADDFLARRWRWEPSILISPVGTDDKDACIMPVKKGRKHLFIHRINHEIWASFVDLINPTRVTDHVVIMKPRPGMWDSKKVGLSCPPLETEYGWLFVYHGISDDGIYRAGLALLDKKDPTKVIARSSDFIFEPKEKYEREGQVGNVVFPCGAVIRKNMLYMYYGAADSYAGVAVGNVEDLIATLLE